MIRISLIIATYNRAEALMQALGSVVEQTLPAEWWECVVVNNRSTDDTAQRFEAFTKGYPHLNLRMVEECEPGVSAARNRGMAEAKAPLVAIIDDDERINPAFLSAYLHFFETHPAAIVAGGKIIAEYPDGRPAWLSKWVERPIANPLDCGEQTRPFPRGRIPGGGNMALRLAGLAPYGVFDPQLGRSQSALGGGEESDLFERLQRGGESLWYLPEAVIWHRIPAEKLTDTYFRNLCYGVGVSQRLRAERYHRLVGATLREVGKWGATLLLLLTLRPLQGRWLLKMRREIARGFFSARH